MMQQYLGIKEEYKDCLLFYRLGDFYELFFEDAKVASKELEITLTGKDCGLEERAPMCGVPFHSADSYIAKLNERGYKVAICEQVEDPKAAKGLVKRDVIRIVTPGTVLDTNVLDEGSNNYIACIYGCVNGYATAFCDVSTGAFFVTSMEEENKVIDEIAKFMPKEIICSEKALSLSERIYRVFDVKIDTYNEWAFDYQGASMCLCNHFGTLNLEGFGLGKDMKSVSAAGALLSYLLQTQKNALTHINNLTKYTSSAFMVLDISSRRNLELVSTLRDKTKKGSLLWVLDKTKTAMGARMLKSWTEQPLVDVEEIRKRLDAVEKFAFLSMESDDLRQLLSSVYDVERIMGKVIYASANARDLVALKKTFEVLPAIKEKLGLFDSELIRQIQSEIDLLEDIYGLLSRAIEEDPPFSVREGGIIRQGFNEEVDRLREAKTDGTKWLTDLESAEREKTDIKNLRVRYNKVFGYYIEVTNSALGKVPDTYIRKQTLTNCERFITPELKKIEDALLGAKDRLENLEYAIFSDIRQRVAENVERINATASAIAKIDALISLGETARTGGYVKPEVNNEGIINIKGGRHPVVEKISSENFIPNDTYLDLTESTLDIITGPNMAGKSTYMRQVALIVLMAQMGSFVPADSAVIGVCDRIFTRVGASDDLATGQSTFMVEMTEVANILHNSTRNSLLILDEIGRGTSTFDGLSIAWAVLEYIAKNIGARTLFATHYHELTELEGRLNAVKNHCISVKESGEDIVFLRKIVKGGADKSYGVHVAKLAGVPAKVTKRAQSILGRLIAAKNKNQAPDLYAPEPEKETDPALLELSKKLEELDPNNITPMQAMQLLFEIKERFSNLEL